jgi:hypothetical protein
MMIRLVSFVLVVLAAFLLPWWATLVGVLYYTRWYTGLELVVAMVLVDAYMGVGATSPYLTIGAVVAVTFSSLLRRWLRTHNQVAL